MDPLSLLALTDALEKALHHFASVILEELQDDNVDVPRRAKMVCIATKISRQYPPHARLRREGINPSRLPQASISTWSILVVDFDDETIWRLKMRVGDGQRNELSMAALETEEMDEFGSIHFVGLSSKSMASMYMSAEECIEETPEYHHLIGNCQKWASSFAKEVCDVRYTEPGIQRLIQALGSMEEEAFTPSRSVTRFRR